MPFSVELKFPSDDHDSYYHMPTTPDSVYQVRGIRPDGKEEYYYSQNAPDKEKTGLLLFRQINGAQKQIDFTAVEISLIPVIERRLDPTSQVRKDYMEKYCKMHNDCPAHNGRRY